MANTNYRDYVVSAEGYLCDETANSMWVVKNCLHTYEIVENVFLWLFYNGFLL